MMKHKKPRASSHSAAIASQWQVFAKLVAPLASIAIMTTASRCSAPPSPRGQTPRWLIKLVRQLRLEVGHLHSERTSIISMSMSLLRCVCAMVVIVMVPW